MWIRKHFSFRNIINFTGIHILWISGWCTLVTCLHIILHDYWPEIPWLPISIIGTAVAFYVGFKNNQSYDRMWEAIKNMGSDRK